jgi:DNA-binding CsgD family transcriptional regulator
MQPGTMVGRSAQLGELVSAWAGGRVRPRTMVITGAAGVGKSTLVAAALDAFAPPPRVALSGTARVHTPAPYDWLAAVLSGRDTDDLPVPADALAWLAQHPDAPRERYAPGALLRLAVRVVRALVGTGPGVLVVEDLHALDPASLNLIGELAVVPDLNALLVVTSQPPDAAVSPGVVARTLARLAGTPGAVRQHLGPLAPPDVAEFLRLRLGGAVPAEVVSAAVARTGGNPYQLSELVAAGVADPLAFADAVPADAVPADAVRADAVRADAVRADAVRADAVRADAVRADAARADAAPAELTAREREVLRCLMAGMSNKQVASSLGISIRTVAVHVSNLLRKTRSASRTEAALWAVRNQG